MDKRMTALFKLEIKKIIGFILIADFILVLAGLREYSNEIQRAMLYSLKENLTIGCINFPVVSGIGFFWIPLMALYQFLNADEGSKASLPYTRNELFKTKTGAGICVILISTAVFGIVGASYYDKYKIIEGSREMIKNVYDGNMIITGFGGYFLNLAIIFFVMLCIYFLSVFFISCYKKAVTGIVIMVLSMGVPFLIAEIFNLSWIYCVQRIMNSFSDCISKIMYCAYDNIYNIAENNYYNISSSGYQYPVIIFMFVFSASVMLYSLAGMIYPKFEKNSKNIFAGFRASEIWMYFVISLYIMYITRSIFFDVLGTLISFAAGAAAFIISWILLKKFTGEGAYKK